MIWETERKLVIKLTNEECKVFMAFVKEYQILIEGCSESFTEEGRNEDRLKAQLARNLMITIKLYLES